MCPINERYSFLLEIRGIVFLRGRLKSPIVNKAKQVEAMSFHLFGFIYIYEGFAYPTGKLNEFVSLSFSLGK